MPLYFGVPQSKRSPHYQEGSRINNLIMNWKFAVFLIAIMGSVSVTLAEDSCSEKNRQQMFENFPYRSDEEKACFNTIRGLESKLERAMSHLKFFRCFTASNVIRFAHHFRDNKGFARSSHLLFVKLTVILN